MADLVGEAYVRVHADTKFMKRAIRRDMTSIGKEGANSLVENFDRTLRSAATGRLKQSQRILADAIVGADFSLMLRRSGKSVDVFVDDVAASLEEMARNSKIKFKDFELAAESLGDWAEKTKMAQEFEASWREAEKLNATLKNQEKIAEQLADRYDQLELDAVRSDVQKLTKALQAEEKAIEDAHAAALKFARQREKDKGTSKDHTRALHGLRIEVSRLKEDLDRISLAGGVGIMFGRGSRNNFLNFIGSVARNITLVGESVFKFPLTLLGGMAEGAGQLADNFKAMRDAGQSIPAILGSGIKGGAAVAGPALAALGAAATALSLSLPVLASAASLAAGGLVAIGSALAFASAGAILPLIPAVVALGAGLAVVVGGIVELSTSMTDAQKRALTPFKDAFEDLRRTMRPVLNDVVAEVAKFAPTFREVQPFIKDMGETALTAFKYLREGIQSPEMDEFFKAWGQSLPKIFEDLSGGVTHLFRGLTAFFTPILPYAEKLASLFEDLMINFDVWARSAEGQNTIKEFMDKAWTAADRLVGILGNVFGAIGNILGIGQESAGGGFLAWLEDVTEQFEVFTSSPEGQRQMQQWFEDAKALGKDFMEIVGDIGNLFDELDSPESRQMLKDFVGFITTVTEYGNAAGQVIGYISTNLSGLAIVMGAIQGGFEEFGTTINEALDGAVRDLQEAAEMIVAPFRWAYDQLFGHSYIPDIVNGFSEWIPRIKGIISGALAGVGSFLTSPFSTARTTLLGILNLLPGDVGSRLTSAVGRIPGALGSVGRLLSSPFQSAAGTVGGILGGLGTTIGRIAGGFPGIASRAVSGVLSGLTSPFSTARDTISRIMSEIAGFIGRIPGLRSAAESGRRTLQTIINGTIDRFNALPLPDVPRLMAGGILTAPRALAGEAGREAVIPLDRPLSQIDPSVREMAALLRGRAIYPGTGGKSITVAPGAIVLTVPNADPELAAEAVLDRLVGLIQD